MDEMEQAMVANNKAVRGYIMRSLAKCLNNKMVVRQLTNTMIAAGLIISPDIGKYLDYLRDSGYIEFTSDRINSYNAYRNDAVIRLTRAGIDLVEGTTEDPGVDI